jgi:hypothetical protein
MQREKPQNSESTMPENVKIDRFLWSNATMQPVLKNLRSRA